MEMKSYKPSPENEQLRLAMILTLKTYLPTMPPDEVLAVLAYTTGQFLGLNQDRDVGAEEPGEIVKANIELGRSDYVKAIGALREDEPA
jgi:hypothetical protein